MRSRNLALALLLPLLACQAEDPRLPDKLYEESKALTGKGKTAEGKVILEKLAAQYRETPAGRQAVRDLFVINTTLKEDQRRENQQVQAAMRRIADALTRYKGKRGEYPVALSELVPDYLDLVPGTPWNHPFLYRPFVGNPVEEVRDRRGNISQHFNTKLDAYHLVCLGRDLAPGGTDAAADVMIRNDEVITNGMLPVIPGPQPVR
jgi:hypothetical protein